MDEDRENGYTVTPQGGYFGEQPPKPETPNEEPSERESFEDIKPSYVPPRRKKEKRTYSIGAVILSALLSAVLSVTVSLSVVTLLKEDSSGQTVIRENGTTNTTINVDKTVSSAVEAVAQKAGPSVVGIRTTAAYVSFFGGSTEVPGEGSGVIYSSDGFIITNFHVIEEVASQSSKNSKIEVFLDNDISKSYPASIIGYNITTDLAVIKIDKTGLTPIEIGDAEQIAVGQFVAAIGCPGGLEFMGSVSYGIVSGLNRTVSVESEKSVELIQTDAAINPGNSGGALLNLEGKLIGINSSKIVNTSYEGMGFSIPVNTVVEVVNNIIAKKDNPTPYIGVTISETYDADTLKELGYPVGAVVLSVVSDGPAYSAGICRGDIITEIGGIKVMNYDKFDDILASFKVNSTVSVTIFRGGRYYTTDVEIISNNAR